MVVSVQHSCHSYVYLWQGMSDARVTVSGTVCLLEDGDVVDAKKVFLQKNPGTFTRTMLLIELTTEFKSTVENLNLSASQAHSGLSLAIFHGSVWRTLQLLDLLVVLAASNR